MAYFEDGIEMNLSDRSDPDGNPLADDSIRQRLVTGIESMQLYFESVYENEVFLSAQHQE